MQQVRQIVHDAWPRLVNALLGGWLMASPALFGYAATTASKNQRVVGPLVVMFALIAVWEVTRPLRWLNLALGLWLIVSPFLLGTLDRTDAMLIAVATGLVIVGLSLVRGPIHERFGDGWSALWRGYK
ncbi:MAG: SPW repeat protein [Candidatus Promineifilaceae bacterium]|nr:SPW repeat protein [Candidatus Promineifilaceae bacterium]